MSDRPAPRALLRRGVRLERATFAWNVAAAVLLGLALNALLGAWWADPLAGFVIAFYGLREARAAFAASP